MENNTTALIEANKLEVTKLFTPAGMDAILQEIKSKATAFVPDMETDDGRKEIAAMAYKVARSKTLIDNIGKDLVSEWKKKAKTIDAHRKTARDFLDNLKDEIRRPLTEYEEEQKRIEAEKLEREKEKVNARIRSLLELNVILGYDEAVAMTDVEFDDALSLAKRAFDEEQILKKQEEERIAKERAEFELAKREQEERDAELRRREEKYEAEKKAFEDAKKKEQEDEARKQQEEHEAKRRAELKAEEEKRQERLRPDREKLTTWVNEIGRGMPVIPIVASEESKAVIDFVLSRMGVMMDEAHEMIDKL